MIELVWVRFFIVAIMLSVSSYYDIKSREINDWVWIIFGIIGVFLYIFDWELFFPHAFFWIGLGAVVACLCLGFRLCGKADVLAIIVLSVIFPVHQSMPVLIQILIAFVMCGAFVIVYNACKNIRSLIKNKILFSDIREPYYKKIFAFFIMHEKSEGEKFGFCGVNKEQQFIFRHNPDTDEFMNGKYVITAPPLMPFLLLSFTSLFFVK